MPGLNTLIRVAAGALLASAATLALPVAPVQAAYCSGGAGVSVLVDYGVLGGGTVTGCGGGSIADRVFASAGFALVDSNQQRGFVCQVNEKPVAGKPCTGASAYWGFFVSDDGKPWAYASLGVHQQAVDQGDSVALVWQSSASQRKPESAPAPSTAGDDSSVVPSGKAAKRPKPKSKPTNTTAEPTAEPTPTVAATTTAATPSPSLAPTRSKPVRPTRTPSRAVTPPASSVPATSTPTADPAPSSTADVARDATAPVAADDGGGLPGWVPPVIVAVLAAAAGGVAWARRAR